MGWMKGVASSAARATGASTLWEMAHAKTKAWKMWRAAVAAKAEAKAEAEARGQVQEVDAGAKV